MTLPTWPVQSSLLALALVLVDGAFAQESPSKSEQAPSTTSAGPSDPSKKGNAVATRRDPDSLKFANGLFRQRKFDLAADEYERFLKSGPTGRELNDARFGLANSRLYQERYREARQLFADFLQAAVDDPRALTARYRVGELSYLLGDMTAARQALEAFTRAKANHPALEMAWTYLGDACFGMKDMPGARLAYQQSLTLYPQGRLADRAKYGFGRTLAELGQPDEGLRRLRDLAKGGDPEWVDRAWLQIGLIEKSNGRLTDALAAFNSLETAAPRSALRADARLQQALTLAQLKRPDEAEILLTALADDASEPLGARAALELATIQLERGRHEAALKDIDDAMKRFPKSPLLPAMEFRSAEALQKLNRLAEAEARFLHLLDVSPNDPLADDAMERAARCALDRGDPAKARRLAVAFATRFPHSTRGAEIRVLEARAASSEGRPKDAVAILESLLGADNASAKNPHSTLTLTVASAAGFELALAYRATGQNARSEAILSGLVKGTNPRLAADAQFLLGQAHLDAKRYTEATAAFEQYLNANPKGDVADSALAQLVEAQLGTGHADDALKTLMILAERFPSSKALPPTRVRLAEAELAAHHAEQAASLFRLVADDTIEPALRIRALAGLGKALAEQGKPDDAASTFATLLKLAPDDRLAAEIALSQARAFEASNRTAAALEVYAEILKRFPSSDQAPRAGLSLARSLTKAGRHAEASRAFEDLIADQPARSRLERSGTSVDSLLAEWGWSLIDAEKPAEADRVFGRLLKEFPNSDHAADARFNLAESANLARNHAEVVRLLTPLAEPKPRESTRHLLPAVLYRLGRTQVELKQWAAASSTLDRLLTDFPDNPYRREAKYLRAESALRNGDPTAAESVFSALLAEPASTTDPKGLIASVRAKQIECWVALKRWKPVLDVVKSRKATLAADDPSIADLDLAQGQALLGLGRLEDARKAFQAVIDVRSGGDLAAHAQFLRGETFFHQDQFHDALREFLKVDILHNAPHWQALALLEAGKVYERLDQWTDAAEIYERLCNRFPADSIMAEARTRRDAAQHRAAKPSAADAKSR
jgi:cellulose synthase operon protein C